MTQILNDSHREHLKTEGFNDAQITELIERDGVRSLSKREALQMGFKCWTGKCWESSSGILFPFTSTFAQLRCDDLIIRANGKPVKYLTQAKRKAQAFSPNGCRGYTEGFKDAQTATFAGVQMGALAGLSHYKALPQGCGLTIVSDSDGRWNPQVFHSLIKSGIWCRGKVLILPEIEGEPKGGISEYVRSGGDFNALFETAAVTPYELLEDWPSHWKDLPSYEVVKLAKKAAKIAAQIMKPDEAKAFNRRLKAMHKVTGLTVGTLDKISKAEASDDDDFESAAQKLIKIGKRCNLFHTADKVAFADVSIKDVRHTYRVRSADFKRWLVQTLYVENEIAANSEAMNSALGVLEGQACYHGDEREVHLRTAQHDGSIYIDLANERWEAVKVSQDGTWAVISSPPVRFLRPATMLPLPTPTRDGSLESLRQLLGVEGNAWALLSTFILFCLMPGQTYPVLLLSACRGSGKTTAAEIIKGLVDPSKAGLVGLSADAHRAAVAGTNRWLMAYDNVSHISPEASDTLCQISTGFGFSTRTLFSTGDETVFELCRPQILTAIDHVVMRDDLSDRLITVNLPEISPENRLRKTELDAKIAKLQPGILGASLTALAQTLRSQHLGLVKECDLPRMADFGAFALHAEQHLGLVKDSFVTAFNESREASRQVILEASPIAEAISQLLERDGDFKGTVSVLHKRLEEFLEDSVIRSRLWPKASNGLSRALNRLKPDLKAVGIEVSDTREGKAGVRLICIEKIDRPAIKQKTSSVSSADDNQEPESLPVDDSTADDKADDTEKSSSANHQVSSAKAPSADDVFTADDRLTIKNQTSSAAQTHTHQLIRLSAGDTDDKSTRLSTPKIFEIGVTVKKRHATGWRGVVKTAPIDGTVDVLWQGDRYPSCERMSDLEVVS
jgi:hypothetical protein